MTDDTDANARATAHSLIESYLGPDQKVVAQMILANPPVL